jgi:hypothetical protein
MDLAGRKRETAVRDVSLEWEIQKRALYLLGEAADLLLLRRGVHESTLRPLAKHLEAISDLISNDKYEPTEDHSSCRDHRQ